MSRALRLSTVAPCLAVAAALSGCGSGGPPQPTSVAPAVVQAAEASVVPVRCTDVNTNAGMIDAANGSGFVVATGIVTASHVISSCDAAGPGSVSAGPFVVAVSANDPAQDLALMRSGRGGRALSLDASLPRSGSPVELLGMPHDAVGASVEPLAGTVVATDTSVTLTAEDGAQETLDDTIVVDANGAIPGDSGGPAIDASGRVIGVIEGGGGQVYLTPASDVALLLG